MILIAIEYSFKQEFVLTQGGEPGTRTQGNCSGCPERFNGRVLHYKFADSTKVSISAILASKNVKFPSRRSYRYSTGVHEFIYKFYSTYSICCVHRRIKPINPAPCERACSKLHQLPVQYRYRYSH